MPDESPLSLAIKQALESLAELQASTDRGFADMMKHITERPAPLEEAVRPTSDGTSGLRIISSEPTK